MEKTLRYALVGCGSFGNVHLGTMLKIPGTQVVALCDLHPESCALLKERYGLEDAACYTDYRELLAKEEVDVVSVVTSDKAHKEVTVAALKAGCHVICEKPMSLFTEECVEMVQAAREAGKLLMVGQVCRCAPGFIKARELVEEGAIGELYYVESEYAHDYTKITGVDNWRVDPDREPIIGGACHAIDLLRWIAGNPVETTAYSNHMVLTDWPVDDTTIAIFKFPNQVIGKVFTSIGCKRNYTMRTVLYGTRGTIIVNNTDPVLDLYQLQEDGSSALTRIPLEINNHNVQAEHEILRDAVLNGTPLVTTGEEGARTVTVCRAVVQSAKTGVPVQIVYPV